ncbi:MAG TPA: isochorismatase family protein, partial [Fimbriimonadaceae bacterium]|nr:isochorismatase family protein [Fimbriimonadaceae bacterium]
AGVETHICVGQTAVDLLGSGMEVIVCPDAVSSRSVERHKLGMERLRDSGALPLHSESVVYEWLETAENPAFRDVLRLVKELS